MEIGEQNTPALPSSTSAAGLPAVKRVRRSRHRRKKRKRLINKVAFVSGIFLAALTVYGVVVIIRFGQAASHLRQAKIASEEGARAIRDEDFDRGRRELKRATDEFTRARNLLSALEVRVLRKAPIVGANLKVATALSLGGAKVADAGAVVLDAVRPLEDDSGRVQFPMDAGKVDLQRVDSLREPVAKAAASVGEAMAMVEQSPKSMLVDSVASARREFLDRVGEVSGQLTQAALYLEIAPELLGERGRRTYLVAIGNNAEMNSGGMVLAYGMLETERGAFRWGRVGSVTELQLPAPVSVPQEAGFYARWDWANPNFAWQRTNVSIDPQAAGSLMGAMIKEKTGNPVDGVIYIDGVAIGYLLRATGPLRFENPSVTLDASNFADYTMNRAYFQFDSQSQRKEFLLEAASKAIEASFQIRGSQAGELAQAVARATSERRLWMWAADSDLEKKLIQVPLGGSALPEVKRLDYPTGGKDSAPALGDFVSYSLINLGGNKVDYYIYNTISHRVEIEPDGSGRVEVQFEIENKAPPDLPEYVGGSTGAGQAARGRGEYLGYLTWYAPEGSQLVGEPSMVPQSELPDGGFAAFSWSVRVSPGGKETLRFSYRLPRNYLQIDAEGNSRYVLIYVPQPRIRPDRFSSELAGTGSLHLEARSAYGASDSGKLYYSDYASSSVRLEAGVRLQRR